MKKGFTLVELICVISIMVIIGAISYPSVSAFLRADRLNTATDTLINDLRYAKMYAITNNIDVKVLLNRLGASYEYDGYKIYLGPTMTIKQVKFPLNVYVDGIHSTFDTNGKMEFNTSGSVSPFACTIMLKDRETGKTSEITLTIGYTRIMKVN